MKKFFSLLCAMLIVLSASAAPQLSKHLNVTKADMVAAKAAKSNPLMAQAHKFNHKPVAKKLAVAKAPAGDATFAFTVADVTYNYANVAVEPSDQTASYYWTIMDEEFYNDILNGAYAQYNINDLCDYFEYDLDYTIQMYAQYGMAITIDDLLSVGPDEYEFEGLDAETGYVVVAIYMDENGCNSDAFTYSFTTPAFELSGVEVNFTSADVEVYDDYLADYGALEVAAFDANDNVFDILFYVQEGFVGTYSEEDIEGAGFFVAVGDDYEQLEVLFADFTVAATATPDVYVLSGDFTMANGDIYHVTITFEATEPEPVNPYEYDEANGVTKVYDDTQAVFEGDNEAFADNGYVYYVFVNNSATDELALYLFPRTLTADGLCPDGVYPISDNMNPGTCYASPGFDGQYVYPSFYATLNGEYISNVWFLVGGDVTITNNGHNIAVDAVNSNGAAVKYTYTEGGAQAIENNAVKANATKALVNGAIVIEKAGARFNLVGARL